MQNESAPQSGRKRLDRHRWLVPAMAVLLFTALALAFASLLYSERWARDNHQYLLRLNEQQNLLQQVPTAVDEAVAGREPAFIQLRMLRDQFETLLDQVQVGSTRDGLPPAPMEAAGAIAGVGNDWQALRDDIDLVLDSGDDLLWFADLVASTSAKLRALYNASEAVAELLADAGAAQQRVLDASRQLIRLREMEIALDAALGGDTKTIRAVQANMASADAVAETLARLTRAEDSAGDDSGLRSALTQVETLYRDLRADNDALDALIPTVLPAVEAASRVHKASNALERSVDQLALLFREKPGRLELAGLTVGVPSALLFAGLAIVSLLALGLRQLIHSRRRERQSLEQSQAHQAAIRRLLDEMGNLADGDLTVEATVTDNPTGAIADSINYAVAALRDLVTTINATSEKVNDAAQDSRAVAARMARASVTQTEQIEHATESITQMTGAIDQIAHTAVESAEVASRSVEVAGRGTQNVRDTIAGMDEIRGRIQETSRRIKRLGESSQEIGEIIELIDDIADRTNILALNAAMQAAMAGEAGRGFAVVADEVQRLAERSGNATRQIESLVRGIQQDTIEAVRSMETSTAGVVKGAELAANAGNTLREMETVSEYIAKLTQEIADSAGNESAQAAEVNDVVRAVLTITKENAEFSRSTALSVELLAELAVELRHSVAGFRLPVA